jgi:hypothetical protein
MSWNSRSKLILPSTLNKFTHTHTHNKSALLKQEKTFKLCPECYPVEWWMMHLFSWESPHFGTEFFVIHPLTSVVTISQEKFKPPLTLGGVLHTFA